MNDICLIGNGGHAKACRDVIQSLNGYSISLGGKVKIGQIIPDSRELTVANWSGLTSKWTNFLIAVGQIKDPSPRIHIYRILQNYQVNFVTIISPHAYVSPGAFIQEGTIIMHNALINTNAKLGTQCIINTGAVIEHDARVGDFCHISTGAVVNGECTIGNRVFLGSNSVLLNQLSICEDVVLGAGSVAVHDITEPGIYAGNPAERIK